MNPLVLILGCLLLSFWFAGIEAGTLSINRVRLRHRIKTKDAAARSLARLLADPERIVITALVVTNFLNILALSLGVRVAVQLFGDGGFWLVLAIALPVWGFGLEMFPKSLFRRLPLGLLAQLSRPLLLANALLGPMHIAGRRLLRALYFRRPPERLKLFGGREDFKYLTFESEREGFISAQERAIIHTVLDFRLLSAQDLMVPLEEAGAVRGDLPLAAARQLARSLGVDRLPVLGEDGQVSGILDLHELAIQGEWHGKVEMFQRRIIRTDFAEPAPVVMRKLRSARLSMAAVRDNSGKTVGVVLWEDLVRLLLLPTDASAN